MKTFLILLLGACLLIGGGMMALTFRERSEAQRERDEARASLAEWKDKAQKLESSSAVLRKERDTAREKLATISNAQAAALPTTGAGQNSGGARAAMTGTGDSSTAKPMKALADMMKNPAMREMVKQQQLAQLDMQYAGLMSRFQLTDEEKANFKQLLGERLQLEGEIGIQMMDDSMTPEQRKVLMQQLADSKKASDERIKTFLNSDEDYTAFQKWEESKPERMQLSMGQSLFNAAGEPLSTAQEQQLVETMYSIRRQANGVPDLSKPENITSANLSEASITQQLEKLRNDNQRVIQEASRYMSAKQLDALKTMLSQWMSMQEAGLRMSSMMMSGKR